MELGKVLTMAIMLKIDELFKDPEKITPESIGPLFQEMMSCFRALGAQLESKDEAERNEALERIGTLREQLEEWAAILSESIGMQPASIEAYLNDPAHFSLEEWEAIRQANEELADFKKELNGKGEE